MRFFMIAFLVPLLCVGQARVYKAEVDETPFRSLQVDQETMHVFVEFEPELGKVSGTVQITFKTLDQAIDSLWIDGINMRCHSVYLNGVGVAYQLRKKGIIIKPENPLLPQTRFGLQIKYECTPQRGLFFVGWDDETGKAPKQIWTQGQGIDHRHWIPHIDAQNDKLITSMAILFDSSYKVVSNGKLESTTSMGANKTLWRYKMVKPHSSYLMMLAIGQYDSFQQTSKSGVELTNYYYPDWQYRNKWTYYQNQEIFDYLEEEIGVPFPWQNYKQVPVRNFQHGAMENTSATIFGDFFCVDSISFNDNNYVWGNAHELAHQWFGNLVTANGSKDHWLHEGFATYYSALAVRHIFGEDEFRKTLHEAYQQAAWAERQDFYPLAHGKAGSARFYKKGAWVVHMLRNTLGKEVFREAIKNYLQANAFGMVTTADLQWFLEEESGKDLDQFFKQWVYGSQIPQLTLHVVQEGRLVNVMVTQALLPSQEPFHLDIPLSIWTHAGLQTGMIKMEGDTANYSFELEKGKKLIAVVPDREFDILANWSIDVQDPTLLHNIAVLGDAWFWGMQAYTTSPWYAPSSAKAMAKGDMLSRMEYAAFLGKKTNSDQGLHKSELKFLKKEQSLDVIKAFLKNAHAIPEDLFKLAQNWLELPSYDVKQLCLNLLCRSNPEECSFYILRTTEYTGTVGHNLQITQDILNYQLTGKDLYAKFLANKMQPEYDFNTRMNAFGAWQVVDTVDHKIVVRAAKGAFIGIAQNNRRLRNAARNFVNAYGKKDENEKSFQIALDLLVASEQLSAADLMRIEKMTGFKPRK